MTEGKADVLEACRHRKMKVVEKPANLLETRIHADGTLDGMSVRLDMNCISGMPGESQGSVTIRGNLAQVLAVLARVWPAAPDKTEVGSPGRQCWPHRRPKAKAPAEPERSPEG